MWPWGHLATGYLAYSLLVRVSGERLRDYPTLALAVGTQFPDLVDKPLAWTFGVIPNGRSLAHSIFTAVVLVLAIRFVLRRYGHARVSTAFGVGYLVHLFGDAIGPFLAGEYYYVTFLGWPVLPAIDYGEKSFAAQLATLELSAFTAIEFGLGALMIGLWIADGRPGLRAVLEAPRLAYRRLSAN
ncbi:metal-dependent hydrolase [Halorussus marinus]|uniref:metal-dependent hydrolase n=1 Tax=Halorussus marinus TaxID=2505976 RepID=UPI00109290A7|nr:metal-dependent hydrolase [Halorussus marinus]